MRLTGWTWLIAGLIVSVLSGYVYLFIPKNGKPNTAMALFFFIGIIFLVVGIVKIFFKRMDDKSVMDSINAVETPQPKIVTLPNTVSNTNTINVPDSESKANRVDETIAQMMQQEQQSRPQVKSQASITQATASTPTQTKERNTHHTSTFSKMYEYKGPIHNSATGANAQHPVSQHTEQNSTHANTVHNASQHPIQNTTVHSIKCKRCGNANSGSSNYCHQCGNRLK